MTYLANKIDHNFIIRWHGPTSPVLYHITFYNGYWLLDRSFSQGLKVVNSPKSVSKTKRYYPTNFIYFVALPMHSSISHILSSKFANHTRISTTLSQWYDPFNIWHSSTFHHDYNHVIIVTDHNPKHGGYQTFSHDHLSNLEYTACSLTINKKYKLTWYHKYILLCSRIFYFDRSISQGLPVVNNSNIVSQEKHYKHRTHWVSTWRLYSSSD